jgi:hypothetical protein
MVIGHLCFFMSTARGPNVVAVCESLYESDGAEYSS